MEAKINIAEILKDKPQGTKLYSLTYGDCFYQEYTGDFGIECQSQNGVQFIPDEYGRYCIEGECILFPSKLMQDWSKFSWKKGDLLINSCGFQCIFKEWASNDYTKFNGCYSNSRDGYEDVSNAETAKFDKLDNNTAYGYIREIERKLGGKLNLETLEIEPAQTEFKDGDILFVQYLDMTYIIIYSQHNPNSESDKEYAAYVSLDNSLRKINYDNIHNVICKKDVWKIRLATEEEKQKLFDALAKEGKAWDAEKKAIVDLKPKVELKPFDKVLVRNDKEDQWSANIFSYQIRDMYYCLGECYWKYCIPYKGNESLLGTTKDVEG